MLVSGTRAIRISFHAILSRRCEQVFIKVNDGLVRPQIQYYGYSVAASDPSDPARQERSRKRLSRGERRAIVEAFVDMYRDSNQGRFPTASHAQHHTGGSYYTVKNIIQELVYNHSVPGCSGKNEFHLREKEVSVPPKQQEGLFSSAEESFTYKSPSDYVVNLSSDTVDSIKKDENNLVKLDEVTDLVDPKPLPFSADEPARTSFSQMADVASVANTDTSDEASYETRRDIVTHLNMRSKEDGQDFVQLNMPKASIQSTTIIHEEFKPSVPDLTLEGQWTCTHPEEERTLKGEKAECFQDGHKEGEGIYSHPQDEVGKLEVQKAKDFKGALTYKQVDQASNCEAPKSNEKPREHLQNYGDQEPSTKGSGIWNNLKSLADGILRFWKKM